MEFTLGLVACWTTLDGSNGSPGALLHTLRNNTVTLNGPFFAMNARLHADVVTCRAGSWCACGSVRTTKRARYTRNGYVCAYTSVCVCARARIRNRTSVFSVELLDRSRSLYSRGLPSRPLPLTSRLGPREILSETYRGSRRRSTRVTRSSRPTTDPAFRQSTIGEDA